MDFDDHIILTYCVCDDCLSSLGYLDDSQCRMSTAEVMTTTIIAAMYQYGNLSRTCMILRSTGYIPKMLTLSRLCKRWRSIPEEVWLWILRTTP